MSYSFKLEKRNNQPYSEQYKQKIFLIWYEHGRPVGNNLLALVPEAEDKRKPTKLMLANWIREDFVPMADKMDAEVADQLKDKLIQEKVEMVQRHTAVAKHMQEMAIKYLNANEKDLSPHIAVRLLVEGIRIESENVGIPAVLKKMAQMTDDDLLKEVQDLMERSPVELLPAEIDGE